MDLAVGAAAAPWRTKIVQALESNKHLVYSRYLQLSTVKLDGRPANRTVVFRGFLDNSDSLTFVTDKRSSKVLEVAANPAAEVCWYLPDSREQFRVAGTLTVVDGACGDARLKAARQLAWSKMSDGGREQFAWPQPALERSQGPDKPAGEPVVAQLLGPQEPALDTFCLVVLDVDQVDHVRLFDNQRSLYTSELLQDGRRRWTAKDVNP